MFEAIIKGLILGILLGISVGPVIFSILKQSLNNGHRGGYAFIAGVFCKRFYSGFYLQHVYTNF